MLSLILRLHIKWYYAFTYFEVKYIDNFVLLQIWDSKLFSTLNKRNIYVITF